MCGCNVGFPVDAQEADRGVPQGRHHPWSVPGPDGRRVLPVDDVAYPMRPVLDSPMTPGQVTELLRACPVRGQARDVPRTGDRALVGEVGTVPGDVDDLCGVREEPFRHGSDRRVAGLDASVSPVGGRVQTLPLFPTWKFK